MDDAEIRRQNLRRYMEEHCNGNQSRLSRRLGEPYTQSFISDLLRGRKSFGEKLARALEERLALDPKALDSTDSLTAPVSRSAREAAPPPPPEMTESEMNRTWDAYPKSLKVQIIATIEAARATAARVVPPAKEKFGVTRRRQRTQAERKDAG